MAAKSHYRILCHISRYFYIIAEINHSGNMESEKFYISIAAGKHTGKTCYPCNCFCRSLSALE